jgi:two-component system phosphate regulon response regulator OmpR
VAKPIGRPRILIVEDDPDDCAFAEGALRADYELDFATDAHEARAKLIGLAPDLIVCDLYMPGESGLELTETVLASRDGRIPVVIVSGLDDQRVVDEAREAGVDGYLVKPYRPDDLLKTVERALHRRHPSAGESLPAEAWPSPRPNG